MYLECSAKVCGFVNRLSPTTLSVDFYVDSAVDSVCANRLVDVAYGAVVKSKLQAHANWLNQFAQNQNQWFCLVDIVNRIENVKKMKREGRNVCIATNDIVRVSELFLEFVTRQFDLASVVDTIEMADVNLLNTFCMGPKAVYRKWLGIHFPLEALAAPTRGGQSVPEGTKTHFFLIRECEFMGTTVWRLAVFNG